MRKPDTLWHRLGWFGITTVISSLLAIVGFFLSGTVTKLDSVIDRQNETHERQSNLEIEFKNLQALVEQSLKRETVRFKRDEEKPNGRSESRNETYADGKRRRT